MGSYKIDKRGPNPAPRSRDRRSTAAMDYLASLEDDQVELFEAFGTQSLG